MEKNPAKVSADGATPSLQQCAETATLKSLGEVANKLCNPFCCGGRLEEQNILLHYKSKEAGELREIRLPGAKEEALTQLLNAGSVASFGKGSEQVTDLSYRDAFKLDPDEMVSSFHPGSTSILGEIETIMVPNRSIRAELHKLNMYTGPGGHFKFHVDTPRSEDMFGSLVVCLPTQFTGGALVTRHKGEQKVFDWSSSPEDPLNVVCWAAFFSDVEHEILPVTSGHRLTLTYNLYFIKDLNRAVSTSNVGEFHTALREALYTPHFLRNGGCLGFDCKHAYVFTSLNQTELLPDLLKGADYAVYSGAKSLSLKVSVKPFMEGAEHCYILPQFSRKIGCYQRKQYDDYGRFDSVEWEVLDSVYNMLPTEIQPGDISCCTQLTQSWKDVFQFITSPINVTPEMLEEIIDLPQFLQECEWKRHSILSGEHSKHSSKKLSSREISTVFSAIDAYCQHRSQLFGVYAVYGNEPVEVEMCYQSAVILVQIPPWGEAPRMLATIAEPSAEHEPPRKKEKKYDEGIADSSKIYFWKKGD